MDVFVEYRKNYKSNNCKISIDPLERQPAYYELHRVPSLLIIGHWIMTKWLWPHTQWSKIGVVIETQTVAFPEGLPG